MDTLSSSVSTLKVPNFYSTTPREFCHLKTPNRQRRFPPPSPHCSHLFSSAKTTTISANKSTSFTHKNLSTSPFFSTSQASQPLTSSPYVHQKPASGYAAALLDIAQCNRSLDAVQKDVQKFSKLLQNAQIQALLSDPFLGDKEKGQVVKELATKGKFNKHLVSLLKMLIERNKLETVSEVLEELERIYDELNETKQVWIWSEKTIGEDRLSRIAKGVQKLTGAVKVKVRNLVTDKLPIPALCSFAV
ncbi:ATP synthase delta chain, chloroplastic-like [Durio zibethinus]|uniref:ATP synthase delta chain, chloroplastic-like n=1 Tax=Durio zibethinus TaxID=66656 RepID=A0A6P6A4F2_DURZI|nr:ATP synthase delta chain, chloroplastic-like [Durio zibethinus]